MRFHFSVKTAIALIFHVSALLVVLFAFLPIAKWYFFHRPILGVDFFNTATYVNFLRDHFHILPFGFKYFWWGGSPISEEIVLSWFLPFSFFARFFPLLESVKIASLFFFLLLCVFIYLGTFRLSKNQFISALITVLVIYSGNMYGSLVWGGSLPYFANQLFFPAVLWLIASYLQTGNKRWYWALVLVVGASFLGHFANGITFVFLGSVLLLFFGKRVQPFGLWQRLKEIGILFLVSLVFSYRITYPYLRGYILGALQGNFFGGLGGGSAAQVRIGEAGVAVAGDPSLISFERSHFLMLFSDTHKLFFLLFGVAFALFLVSFIVDRKKRNALGVIAWLLLAGYSVAHVFLNSYGISFLSQAWYRAFWHFPITLGLAIAALTGYSLMAFGTYLKLLGRAVFVVITLLSLVTLGGLLYSRASDQTIQLLEARSSPSSSHPEAINLVRNNKELEALKLRLVPSFLDPHELNYRIYTSDAQVNVWWNALFEMPLARGYLDPPVGTALAGHHFLLDQSVAGDGLVTNFKYQEDVAKNMALYYIDWYAVKYLEGGRLSKSPNKGPSSYLKDAIEESQDVEVKGAYILYQTKSGKPEIWEHVPQYLKYYQFRDELVAPILSLNNSPSVLCFCDWGAYESVTKALSMNNINSRFLITAFSQEQIDSLSLSNLSAFDALILANYKYGNRQRAFSRILDYVKQGGKVFIDTGSEVKESMDTNLPEIFSFRSAERRSLGKSWDFSVAQDSMFENIDFEAFSLPLYNKDEWKFSYPKGDIDSSAQVLLKNHGKPLLIRKNIGRGQVLWSGMNLAYHIHANTNVFESKLYVNLLRSLVPLTIHNVILGKPQFKSDRYVEFLADREGRGVLFKEQFFNGWNISVNGRGVKAYRAGPTFPGFIYVPLDEGVSRPINVSFEFWGRPYQYIIRLLSFVIGLFLLELAFFDGRILGRRVFAFVAYLRKRVGMWWQREEE